MTDKRRVVIVGGGFGGVRLALKLSNRRQFDVKIISDKPYFEYHAALYRSATGRSPLEVAIPLRDLFEKAKNVEVIEDKVTSFDAEARTATDSSGCTWKYDSLVLAVGKVDNYFGIKGLKEHAHSIKTIQQALAFKRHLHDAADSKRFVVIGAGPSGVELAGELPSYLRKVRKKHGLPAKGFEVELIEAKDKILPTLPASFTGKIEDKLKKSGVDITLEGKVEGETAHKLKVNGKNIEAEVVAWTAGTMLNPLIKDSGLKLTERHLIQVDEYLQATENVYAIGDIADTKFSGMAQTAIEDANQLATNLIRQAKGKQPKAYDPHKPIYAIPAGPKWSGVLWGSLRLYGFGGWSLRRLADLRLYLTLLTPIKALGAWQYGLREEEICQACREKM